MIPTKPPPFFKNPEKWSADMQEFVKKCLVKNPEERMSATQLLQVKLGFCLILLLNSSHEITDLFDCFSSKRPNSLRYTYL